jgi:RecA-family ATPase
MVDRKERRGSEGFEEAPPDPGIIPGGIRDRALKAVRPRVAPLSPPTTKNEIADTYLASIPNPGTDGSPKFLRTSDPALIERWIKAENRPGFSIYECPNPLKPGAARHGKENLAAIVEIFTDIDFKNVVEMTQQADEKLAHLPLMPSELVDSGHGRHPRYRLKEAIPCDDPDFERACAIQEKLTVYFAADPQVRPWSLLRRPGTLNSKHEPHVVCRILQKGPAVDLTELEEFCELVEGTTLLTRKPKAGNGHDRAEGEPRTGPVDVPAELATITDGASANAVQSRVIASLLRKGEHPDDVLKLVVDATLTQVSGWTRDDEVPVVIKRITSAYKNLLLKDYNPATGVIPDWLPGDFHAAWIEKLQAGRRPAIGFNRGGFYVRSYGAKAEEPLLGGGGHGADSPATNKPEIAIKTASERRVLTLRPFVPFDVATLPPRSWLYSRQYQRRTVSLTAGPGGMGKSSNDMVEAIAMATARSLLGEQPEERLRIWYHNGEDPRDEINRRLAAICQHYKISQEELQGYLWTTSGTEFPLRVAKGYANLEINTVLVREISAAISENQIDVAIFDPLVTLHSVSEVDTGKMDAVVRLFAGIADDNDCAIEIAHHVRKPAAGANNDYDVHDIRGVAAITDAVRAARVLNRMNEKDAEAAGCGETERLSRFRVDRAKGNYSPACAATWRQFVNVALVNGDEVGVVAPWDFPGQGRQTPEKDAADHKAEQMFLRLLDKLAAQGVNVNARPGPASAPARFAKEKEAKDAKVSKAALAAAMGRLFDKGRIRSEPYGRGDRDAHRLVSVPQQ